MDNRPSLHIIKDTHELLVDKNWSQNEGTKCKKEWGSTTVVNKWVNVTNTERISSRIKKTIVNSYRIKVK